MGQSGRCPVCGSPAVVPDSHPGKLYSWVDCDSCGGPFPLSYMARVELAQWADDDPRRAQVAANMRTIGQRWPDDLIFDTRMLGTLSEWSPDLVASHFFRRRTVE